MPAGVYDVTVPLVHDGDTLWADIPVRVKVRLDGIQAAELSTPKGKEVAAWLKERIEGKAVALTLGGDYKFGGERMGSVSIDGVDVAQEMVAAGLAVKWDGRGPRPVGHTPEELATMTDSEKLDLLMREREDREAADERLAAVTGVRPVRMAADPSPRPPFPWDKAIPLISALVIIVLGYFGVSVPAQNAASHAEAAKTAAVAANTSATAAVIQGEKNEVKIEQTHGELKAHGQKLDRVVGNVADRVPGK